MALVLVEFSEAFSFQSLSLPQKALAFKGFCFPSSKNLGLSTVTQRFAFNEVVSGVAASEREDMMAGSLRSLISGEMAKWVKT